MNIFSKIKKNIRIKKLLLTEKALLSLTQEKIEQRKSENIIKFYIDEYKKLENEFKSLTGLSFFDYYDVKHTLN